MSNMMSDTGICDRRARRSSTSMTSSACVRLKQPVEAVAQAGLAQLAEQGRVAQRHAEQRRCRGQRPPARVAERPGAPARNAHDADDVAARRHGQTEMRRPVITGSFADT